MCFEKKLERHLIANDIIFLHETNIKVIGCEPPHARKTMT
jgi:hypothetical protein